MTAPTITEFLLARLGEDEAVARSATAPPWVQGVHRKGEPGRWHGIEAYSVLADRTQTMIYEHETVADSPTSADVAHIARHDPARVLAECEAKRRIVELHDERDGAIDDSAWTDEAPLWLCKTCHDYDRHDGMRWPCPTIRYLAAVYADHPDYDEGWRVE